MDSTTIRLRTYDPRDEQAVWTLHEWAMRDTGVDPADIPGTDDLRAIESSYFDTGGTFVVGTLRSSDQRPDRTVIPTDTRKDGEREPPVTHDGRLVAMGGYLPNEAGYDDERDRLGAVELHRMRVAPPYQRRGYGDRVLSELERRAAADEFNTVLATTSTNQPAAIEFYQDRGYERMGTSTAGEYELVHFEKSL